jgi:hypothetical protein
MTHLTNQIMKCADSRRSATLSKNNPSYLCYNDWCKYCSVNRTDLIVDAALNKFKNTNNKMYHTTAVIGPAMNFTQGNERAIQLLLKIAELDLEIIGSLEYADPKFTPGFNGINQKKPFFKTLHFANSHFHWITNQYYKRDDSLIKDVLFNYDHQIYQQIEGVGKYKDQPRSDFIRTVIEYGRKRNRIINKQWFKSVKASDQQLTYMTSYKELFLWDFKENRWSRLNVLGVEKSRKEFNEEWRNRMESLDNLNQKSVDNRFNDEEVAYKQRNEKTPEQILLRIRERYLKSKQDIQTETVLEKKEENQLFEWND